MATATTTTIAAQAIALTTIQTRDAIASGKFSAITHISNYIETIELRSKANRRESFTQRESWKTSRPWHHRQI